MAESRKGSRPERYGVILGIPVYSIFANEGNVRRCLLSAASTIRKGMALNLPILLCSRGDREGRGF